MRYSPYYDSFAAALLSAVGAPVTRGNMDGIVAWVGGEAGWSGANIAVRRNNPLNIKSGSFRDYGIAMDGVQYITNVDDGRQGYGTYTSLERGAAATAAYLVKAGRRHGYDKALAALKRNDAVGFLNGIAASNWAASHYGYPKTNHLLQNLAYVRASGRPPADPAPEMTDVKYILAYDPPRTISAPAGTPLLDLAYQPISNGIPTPTTFTTVGLADGHSGKFVVKVSTGRYSPDHKPRATWQIAVIPNGVPED